MEVLNNFDQLHLYLETLFFFKPGSLTLMVSHSILSSTSNNFGK